MYSEPARVFKPLSAQSNAYSYSSNTFHVYNACLAQSQQKQPKKVFRVCAGCKAVAYCSPECQKTDWRRHKAFCKQQQAALTIYDEPDNLHPEFLRAHSEALTSEDFIRAHTYTFTEAICSVVALGAPFDKRKKHVFVQLQERPEVQHDGNPATLYQVEKIELLDNPTLPCDDMFMDTCFVPLVTVGLDDWVRRAKVASVTEVVVVLYRVGMGIPWLWPLAYNIHTIPGIFDRESYLLTVKEFTGKGIVFRLTDTGREPGVLQKKGANWVWEQKTLAELQNEYGITRVSYEALQARIHWTYTLE